MHTWTADTRQCRRILLIWLHCFRLFSSLMCILTVYNIVYVVCLCFYLQDLEWGPEYDGKLSGGKNNSAIKNPNCTSLETTAHT